MPHNRPSTIDSCAMPGTIKGGFATPQIAQHHGIRARVTQLPSRTTNRKEDEMFRARPRYRPLLLVRGCGRFSIPTMQPAAGTATP